MGARVYNPQTGRFLQVDPVEGGSCNAYEYVCQDPLDVYDLDGTNILRDAYNGARAGVRATGRVVGSAVRVARNVASSPAARTLGRITGITGCATGIYAIGSGRHVGVLGTMGTVASCAAVLAK